MNSIALTTVHPGSQGISLPKIGTLIPNRIFVGGISSNTTEDELRMFFSVFGNIKDVKVIYDKSNLSKGNYGFVTFEDQETAENIIKNEAETLIFKDRKLNIGYAVRKQHIFPKQDLANTLLVARNTCPLSGGLSLVQLCPHEPPIVAMNQPIVYYPTTLTVAPNLSTNHEACTAAALNNAVNMTGVNSHNVANHLNQSGSGSIPINGILFAHTLPAAPVTQNNLPSASGMCPCPNRLAQPSFACWRHNSTFCDLTGKNEETLNSALNGNQVPNGHSFPVTHGISPCHTVVTTATNAPDFFARKPFPNSTQNHSMECYSSGEMIMRWSDGSSLIPYGVTNELETPSAPHRSPATVHHRLPSLSLTRPDSRNELRPTMPSLAMTCGSNLLRTTVSDEHRHTTTTTNITTTTGIMRPHQQHSTTATTNNSLNYICFNSNHRHTLPCNPERSRVQDSLSSNSCRCKLVMNELSADTPLNVIPSVWGHENKTFTLRGEPTSSPVGTFVNSSCNTRCSLNPAGLIHAQCVPEDNRFTAIKNSQSTGDETGHTTCATVCSADMLIRHVWQSQSQAVGSESNRLREFDSVPLDSSEVLIDSAEDPEQHTFDTINDPGQLTARPSIQSENKTNSSASAYNTQRFAQTANFIAPRPSNWLHDSSERTTDDPKHMYNNTLEMGERFLDNFQNHQHMIHSESKSLNPLTREFSFDVSATTAIPSSSAQTEVDHRLTRMNCSESSQCFFTSNSASKLNKPMVDTGSSGHSVTTTTLSACGDILKSRQL
ncbi:hypothetical protein P879_09532 [Paragonimus westermani]|uniref:RRM domain-containing protein n=1 Tax=Paragonimus westermani TaxID=34504 RepID=A0A8T0DGN0_9TREM|nr:hypothetical protein P879_09532 [Paragonimus westermani]